MSLMSPMIIPYYSLNSTPSLKIITSESSWRNVNFSRQKQTTSDFKLEIDGGNSGIKR